jgi:hypothetical protein
LTFRSLNIHRHARSGLAAIIEDNCRSLDYQITFTFGFDGSLQSGAFDNRRGHTRLVIFQSCFLLLILCIDLELKARIQTFLIERRRKDIVADKSEEVTSMDVDQD